MAVRIRKDVFKLTAPSTGQWHPDLLWYARAVAEMQRRPIGDHTSWRYQAAIHDYDRQDDPLAQSNDVPPSSADQARFWSQCQHFSWFFLSWHRMYLLYFEEIVAATVKQLGGPGWALPYWNYSDPNNPDARRLPPEFRQQTTPDNVPNPLLVNERNFGANSGEIIADEFDVDIADCLAEPSFVAQGTGGNPGFGGPETGFNHGSGNVVGLVEMTPHGSMHVAVGGYMGAFNTAGLDPLFWLHHCNIDRLWTVWQRRNPTHKDPTQSQWLTGVKFPFRDAAGNVVELTSNQVVDTRVALLNYDYDDVSDPLGEEEAVEVIAVGDRPIPEMVGATEKPVVLTTGTAEARLSLTPPTGPGERPEAVAEPEKIYLNVENIVGASRAGSYAVYLNVPAGDRPEAHPELLAGVLPMFGLAEASAADSAHAGSGLHYALEVGKIVRRLREENAWDPSDVRISFVPRRPAMTPEGAPEAAPEPITVGRVSLYFA